MLKEESEPCLKFPHPYINPTWKKSLPKGQLPFAVILAPLSRSLHKTLKDLIMEAFSKELIKFLPLFLIITISNTYPLQPIGRK